MDGSLAFDGTHARVHPTTSFIPLVGLGSWTQRKEGEIRGAVLTALRVGYRHIDCAAEYKNEGEVGAALREVLQAGLVQRQELWVTSKLMNSDHDPERVEQACRESLSRLGLDYLDLYLMHWPITNGTGPTLDPPLQVTWAAMEGLVRKGLVRAIGVSNFSIRDPAVLGIAEKLGKSPAEVVLRWAVQRGTSVTPKSTSEAHLRSNLAVTSWELSVDDFKAISALSTQCRMLDGGWFLSPEGPYRTLEELWDTESETATSGKP